MKNTTPKKAKRRGCNNYNAQKSSHVQGKLVSCPYCKRNFCKNHQAPRPGGLRNFSTKSRIYDLLEKERQDPNTHPCFQYSYYLVDKLEKQNEKEIDDFLAFLDRGKKSYKYFSYNEATDFFDPKPFASKSLSDSNLRKKSKKSSSKIWKTLFFILLFISIILLISWESGYLNSLFQKPSDGSLEQNINSQLIFNKINSLRENSNVLKLIEDRKSHELSLFLAKKKFENGYGISESLYNSVAQNYSIYGEFRIFSGEIDKTQGFTEEHLVSRWGEIFSEEILDSKWIFGNVGCYGDTCYLVLRR